MEHPSDRVIAPHVDVAVMKQEKVGNIFQSLPSFRIGHDNGFVALIAAGHHQSLKGAFMKQQDMQRRVGQKSAQKAVSRRDAGGNDCPLVLPFPLEEDDRPLEVLQQFCFPFADFAVAPDDFESAEHHCKRLFFANLTTSEATHDAFLGGRDGQVEAPQTFDGQNRPLL